MKIRTLLVVAVVLAASLGWAQERGSKDDETKIIAMEKQLWDAWKSHDGDVFNKHLADDSIGVTSTGVEGKDKAVQDISKSDCKVNNYSFENTKVTWLDEDTAMLTYKANQDATCEGQKLPPSVWASSLWVKRGGDWKAMFHQETPARDAMSRQMESTER